MRFKGTLANPSILHKISQTLEKLGPDAIIALRPQTIKFITCQDDYVGIQAWLTIQSACLFSNYRVESSNNNEIMFSFSVSDLLIITRDLTEPTADIEVYLRKRGQDAFLLFTWTSEDGKGTTELPIRVTTVVRNKDFTSFRAPDTYIVLPDLHAIKHTAERFKFLGKYITISANLNGVLKLESESLQAICSATFDHLENPTFVDANAPAEPVRDKSEFCSVRVSSDDLFKCLSCHHLEPDNIICSIVDETQVAFIVYWTDNYVQSTLTIQLPIYYD